MHSGDQQNNCIRVDQHRGFETLPLPPRSLELQAVAEEYCSHRKATMLQRRVGLTRTYDLLNDPDEDWGDIAGLRELRVELDRAVARAYGWLDLDLGHGFHETRQGARFTISEIARQEVLDRLLELNHQRYAEEVEAGLHDKSAKRPKSGKRRSTIAGNSGKIVQPDLDLGFELA